MNLPKQQLSKTSTCRHLEGGIKVRVVHWAWFCEDEGRREGFTCYFNKIMVESFGCEVCFNLWRDVQGKMPVKAVWARENGRRRYDSLEKSRAKRLIPTPVRHVENLTSYTPSL